MKITLECVTRQENTRTFLVIMKLVPMATELETASARPMYLSSTIARGLGVKDPEGRRPQAGEWGVYRTWWAMVGTRRRWPLPPFSWHYCPTCHCLPSPAPATELNQPFFLFWRSTKFCSQKKIMPVGWIYTQAIYWLSKKLRRGIYVRQATCMLKFHK